MQIKRNRWVRKGQFEQSAEKKNSFGWIFHLMFKITEMWFFTSVMHACFQVKRLHYTKCICPCVCVTMLGSGLYMYVPVVNTLSESQAATLFSSLSTFSLAVPVLRSALDFNSEWQYTTTDCVLQLFNECRFKSLAVRGHIPHSSGIVVLSVLHCST